MASLDHWDDCIHLFVFGRCDVIHPHCIIMRDFKLGAAIQRGIVATVF